MMRKRQTGVSLIEVLVTLVIVSIGLLGSLRMQLLSIRANTDAGMKSRATVLTNDFAERIRINRTAARAGDYDDDTINYGAINCATVPATPCWDRAAGTALQCTSAQMATSDAWRWVCALELQVPSANTPTVDWDDAVDTYTIGLTWSNIDLNGVAQDSTITLNLVP